MNNKPKIYTIIYVVCGAALALLFVYLLLDFFVIPRVQKVDPLQIVLNTPSAATDDPGRTGVPGTTDGQGMHEFTDNSEEDTASFVDLFGTPSPGESGTGSTGNATPADSTAGSQTDKHTEGAATPVPTPTPSPVPQPTPIPTMLSTENEYHNGSVDIVITKYRQHGTDIYVADVLMRDVFSLRAAFAKNTYGKNIIETTSQQAKNNHAVLAINGDFYGKRENGYVVRNGQAWRTTVSGRNERNTKDDLAVLQDGSFMCFSEDEMPFDELVTLGPWQVFSFGPAIIKDGEICVRQGDDVMNHLSSNPRTAIAEIAPLHYLLVVSDGRTDDNEGLSLLEMAQFLKSLGAVEAYNFDGGGSTAMYFNGKIINKPVNNGKITERFVSDIVYIPE
ncbi:MAG: phosphodiester glycosidase family protein [Clostridia bacterium]|nr:phosphodiester glycosidase family protein [Clostridia bacterium]